MSSSETITKKDLDQAVDEVAQVTNNAITAEVGQLRTEMQDGFENIDQRFEKQDATLQRMLQIIESIDQKLIPLRDIPERVERLEKHVYG